MNVGSICGASVQTRLPEKGGRKPEKSYGDTLRKYLEVCANFRAILGTFRGFFGNLYHFLGAGEIFWDFHPSVVKKKQIESTV